MRERRDERFGGERNGRCGIVGFVVVVEIQKEDGTQKMKEGILRKLDQNPELKKNIQEMVKNLPESQREQATISIERQAMRATAPKQTPTGGMTV